MNPNNPTGSYLTQKDIFELEKISNQKKIPLIIDEVFFDYSFKERKKIEFKNFLTFRINGISKMLALPQFKLSWIAIFGNKINTKLALNKLEIISDTFLSVNSIIQNAFPNIFLNRKKNQIEILKRIKNNFYFLKKTFLNSAIDVLHIEGGWNAICRFPNIIDDENFAIEILKKKNVLVHPGSFYGFSKNCFFVISLLISEKKFQNGILKIKKLCEQKFQ